jgi:hypothetical protein
MEKAVEHSANGRRIPQQLTPVFHRSIRSHQSTGAFVAAHADRPIKACIDQRAAVKTVAKDLLSSPALRAMVRPLTIGIGNRFLILLDGTGERV